MGFTRFTTPDGRWEYGTGDYDKTIADYLGVRAPGDQTSLPGKLAAFIAPAAASAVYGQVKAITIPVFYIWAKPTLGGFSKRIAEWPFAKSMRDAAFASFVPAVSNKYVSDLQRDTLLKQLQATAGAPGVGNLARLVAVEKQMLIYNEIDKLVRHAARTEAGGTFLVLAAAAAVGLFVVLS